jgi:L-alanine-DL-glutamate epimerase-like enolase superfamily enzyme
MALAAAAALSPLELWWFEDVCDPLDFGALADVVRSYKGAVAAGEALFSVAEAKLLDAHGGIRKDKDILLFDPVHCYGLVGYLQIVKELERRGWERKRFWPHGGHLFTLHVVQGLGLGGVEVNPLCFQPFGGLSDDASVGEGRVCAPDIPGIGFEGRSATKREFNSLLGP